MSILYIVATPIGNLKDITLRALETLRTVQLIIAEDTRVTKKLLLAHGIDQQLLSYHQHNSSQRDPQILDKLKAGTDIALVTDAGTPLLSDPGHSLVALCRQHDIKVVPIPGVSALTTAISVNDFNVTKFSFVGYLPAKQSARRQTLTELSASQQATLLYETKHRIIEVLEDMRDIVGPDRLIMVARELTKLHEQIVSGSVQHILTQFEKQNIPNLGEYVILMMGDDGEYLRQCETARARDLFSVVCPVLTHKAAVELACSMTTLPKNLLYDLASEYYRQ